MHLCRLQPNLNCKTERFSLRINFAGLSEYKDLNLFASESYSSTAADESFKPMLFGLTEVFSGH